MKSRAAIFFGFLGLALLIGQSFSGESISPTRTGSLLRVHFIDVDQGDGILIQTPDGAVALIDGGYDNGLALAYLQQQGIEHVDAVIASHPHADHIGGLIEVMQALPVSAVWTSGASHTTSYYERFLDTIIERQIPYYEVVRGGSILLDDLHLDVLHSERSATNLNDTSLVLHLQYGEVSFLFTGDAEVPAEHQMLRTVPEHLAATVLKVGHHGSRSSSSSAFLAAVQPQIAVYSAGRHNSYGHPHSGPLANLAAVGATVYGTDIHGTVIVETDGVEVQVMTELAEPLPAHPVPVQVMVTALPTGMTDEEPVLRYDPFGPDRDCRHFDTHAEAQAFFLAAGGPARDPHRLDGDSDGIACESLP